MADTEKKISELDSAAQINTDDITVLSQGSAGTGFASVKATILAIANKIVSGINFSSALQTTDKTITGAINEVAQGGGGGASDLDDLNDVSITSPSNGQVLKYNSTSQEWENANESGGGSGGHTILDDSGNDLAQEDDLQFAGTYSEDDSINGKTVVNITREMTQADYDLLSANKKKGIIRITDNNYVCDATEASFDNTGTSFTSDDVDGALREVDSAFGDILYIKKGVNDLTDCILFGIITGNGQNADVIIPCSYDSSISGIASVSLNVNAGIFSSNDVVYVNSIKTSEITVSKTKVGLRLRIPFTSSVTANKPCVVMLNSANSITFN